jgi:Ca2+-dependent lipid-binding protein
MSRKPSKMQSMFKHGPTNIPAADTRLETYTVEITFHSACNLPVADIHTLAGDPYLHAFIHVRDYANPPDEPPLAWRIPTASRTRNPEWNCKWVVAGIPNSGFLLKIKAVDEDCGGRDDRLGKAYLQLSSEHVKEGYELKQKNLRISKRKGSVVPYIMTYVVGVLPGQRIVLHPEVIVSVKVLHKDKKKLEYMKAYTIGPSMYPLRSNVELKRRRR